MNKFVLLIITLILTTAHDFVYANPPSVDVSLVSGYFTLSQAGELVEGVQYAKQQTAEAGAINRSFACNCEVLIHRPDIRVNATLLHESDNENTTTATWNTPTKRENGDTLLLAEIQHYILEYWHESGDVISITVGKSNEFIVHNLDKGQWFFRVATRDTNELQASWSEIATKTI